VDECLFVFLLGWCVFLVNVCFLPSGVICVLVNICLRSYGVMCVLGESAFFLVSGVACIFSR